MHQCNWLGGSDPVSCPWAQKSKRSDHNFWGDIFGQIQYLTAVSR